AHVGDVALPLPQLLQQVVIIDEDAAGEEVPLEVLHAGFHLALGLGAIRLAQVWLEAPVVGELLERGVPHDAPVPRGMADGARPIVQMLTGVAAEVFERALVRVEKLAQRLADARLMEAPAGIPQRQDEHVQRDRPVAEVDAGLAPVDLTLLARRRLEPDGRALRGLPGATQRSDETPDRLVAAPTAPLPPQLLEQDPRRVLHQGSSLLEERPVLDQ